MSEVIGYLLVFFILSMILVLSMVAFGIAHDAARERAIALRAESAAARVAGVVVQAAVLAEQESPSSPVLRYGIELPDQLEGYDYTIRLVPGEADHDPPDLVRVSVPGLSLVVTAPLFSASAPANLHLCDTTVSGGSVQVAYDAVTASTSPTHTTCAVSTGTKVLFLQVTP